MNKSLATVLLVGLIIDATLFWALRIAMDEPRDCAMACWYEGYNVNCIV